VSLCAPDQSTILACRFAEGDDIISLCVGHDGVISELLKRGREPARTQKAKQIAISYINVSAKGELTELQFVTVNEKTTFFVSTAAFEDTEIRISKSDEDPRYRECQKSTIELPSSLFSIGGKAEYLSLQTLGQNHLAATIEDPDPWP
jgi:hypothetical protein